MKALEARFERIPALAGGVYLEFALRPMAAAPPKRGSFAAAI
jgi:hypothetical protein